MYDDRFIVFSMQRDTLFYRSVGNVSLLFVSVDVVGRDVVRRDVRPDFSRFTLARRYSDERVISRDVNVLNVRRRLRRRVDAVRSVNVGRVRSRIRGSVLRTVARVEIITTRRKWTRSRNTIASEHNRVDAKKVAQKGVWV